MRKKQYRKLVIAAACVCVVLLIGLAEHLFTGQLPVENVAGEWSKDGGYAAVSAFFSEDAGVTDSQVMMWERSLATALEGASQDVSDSNGRNLVDCYSAEGELTVCSEKTSAKVRAFGIGNDFFLFHPLTLLDGNYFNGTDENGDGVILDENVAWQLFGSAHVAGMNVEINGVTYPIRGVVRSDKGAFSGAAEEEKATVYVAYSIMSGDGEEALPLDSYEILIRNPVQKFGYNALKDAVGLDEAEYELVENSARYSLLNRLTILRSFGARSMRTKNIVYPYWENRARAYEDVTALLLVIKLLLLIYPFLYACGRLHAFWKQKKEIGQRAWHGIRTFASYLPGYVKRWKEKERPERKKRVRKKRQIAEEDRLE